MSYAHEGQPYLATVHATVADVIEVPGASIRKAQHVSPLMRNDYREQYIG